ncbi:hypothetical protein ACONVD_004369, partial [Escherichia coli]
TPPRTLAQPFKMLIKLTYSVSFSLTLRDLNVSRSCLTLSDNQGGKKIDGRRRCNMAAIALLLLLVLANKKGQWKTDLFCCECSVLRVTLLALFLWRYSH